MLKGSIVQQKKEYYNTPAGKILFIIISAFAEFEREIIRERVPAGVEKTNA